MGNVIILADDDLPMREALTAALEEFGLEIVGVGSGREALEIAEDEEADAIITDLSMPGGTGFDLLTVLSEKHRPVPVIVLSGHTEPAVQDAALAAGAAAFLVKPISIGDLLAALERVLPPSVV